MTYDATIASDHLMFIAHAVATYGQAVIAVGSGQCFVPGCECEPEAVPWAYTIGLVERDHPEVVTLGLPPGHAVAVLNWVHDREVAGDRLDVAEVRHFEGVAVQLLPVPETWVASEHDPMASWFAHYSAGRPPLRAPPVLQLLWADDHGRFPGETSCRREVDARQPRLDRHPTWVPGSPHPDHRKPWRVRGQTAGPQLASWSGSRSHVRPGSGRRRRPAQ